MDMQAGLNSINTRLNHFGSFVGGKIKNYPVLSIGEKISYPVIGVGFLVILLAVILLLFG